MKKKVDVPKIILRNAWMKVQIKPEYKNLVHGIWKSWGKPRVHSDDKIFEFEAPLEAFAYNEVMDCITNINKFYPEAEAKLELEVFH